MKLQTLFRRSVENENVIKEEELGFGGGFVQHHQTEIRDPEVRRMIQRMSYFEVIG